MSRHLVDITGKRFGMLKVLKVATRTKYGVKWWCKCSCGKTKAIEGNKIKCGATRSCGCLRAKLKDIKGEVFGRLTVTKLNRIDKYAFWDCRCSCGREVCVSSGNLRRGNTTSCGCIRLDKVGRNKVISRYKKHALEYNRKFNLSIKVVEKLMSSDCVYCGHSPSMVSSDKSKEFKFIYNGIDRVDNNKGYIRGNVVSCCRWCNIAKRDRSVSEFYEWARKLSANINNWPVYPE